MLTKLEKKVIASIQGDLAITPRPYLEIAAALNISEELLLQTLTGLCSKGVIRRFGATLRHQKSGFSANAMTAWQVEPKRIDEVGHKMALFNEVSHCYARPVMPGWPYNLYTMIHAADEASCQAIAKKIALSTKVKHYTLLFSQRELKKSSMVYFQPEKKR